MRKQDGLLLPKSGVLAPACDMGAPFGAGEKMEREKRGRRPTLVTEAGGLLKGSRCFRGCRLAQCYLHNATLPAQHRISGDLTSSKLNDILIQVLGELTALYSHYVGLTPTYTIAHWPKIYACVLIMYYLCSAVALQ